MVAKKKGIPPLAMNMALLKQIADATAAGGFVYVSREDGEPLMANQPPLIEVNTSITNESGHAAARITEEGKKMLSGETVTNTSNAGANALVNGASPYAIINNAALPPSGKRGGKGGGAPTQYPFDQLEIGNTFFVPVSAKHKDPVKQLGSSVSAANMKYSKDTGRVKPVTRAKRGEKNRAVLDASGNKIMETVNVPIYEPVRKFVVRRVKSGETYGAWVAPADGALVARVALNTAE